MSRFEEYGINVRRAHFDFPTQHYQNGGVEIDPDGETCARFVSAGECSGGVQGLTA